MSKLKKLANEFLDEKGRVLMEDENVDTYTLIEEWLFSRFSLDNAEVDISIEEMHEAVSEASLERLNNAYTMKGS